MKTLLISMLFVIAVLCPVKAADLNGKWPGEMAIRNGKLLGDEARFSIDIPAGLSSGFTMLFEGQAGVNDELVV